jgi:hypothetical protein
MARERRYLILMNESVGGPALMQAVEDRIRRGPCRFHLVVPGPPPATGMESILSAYAGEVRAKDDWAGSAERRLEVELAGLRAVGANVDGAIGHHDPVRAIEEALKDGTFDEVILCLLPLVISHLDDPGLPDRVSRHVDLPVVVIEEPWPVHAGLEAAVERATLKRLHRELDDLEHHIGNARADVARLHHADERHFIDTPTRARLEQLARQIDELRHDFSAATRGANQPRR